MPQTYIPVSFQILWFLIGERNADMDTLQVHMVEWLKQMVGSRRAEEVVDSEMEAKPTKQALKRALLVALKCVDPVADRRPTMGQAVRMLEAEAGQCGGRRARADLDGGGRIWGAAAGDEAPGGEGGRQTTSPAN